MMIFILQTLQLDASIILQWHEQRLAWEKSCYNQSHVKKFPLDTIHTHHFWQPRVFYIAEHEIIRSFTLLPFQVGIDDVLAISEAQTLGAAQSITLSQAGDVVKFARLNIDIECELDFSKFPFDNQVCEFIMELSKFTLSRTRLQCQFFFFAERDTSDEVVLDWTKKVSETTDVSDLRTPDWDVTLGASESFTVTGKDNNSESLGICSKVSPLNLKISFLLQHILE